jgi:hypothetical protein
MPSKKFFFRFGSFSINDGSQIRFWEDKWLGNMPLSKQYHVLYKIVLHKSDTIATVMATSPLDVTFRRDLINPRLVAWNILLQHLASIQLSPRPDVFRWNLHANGIFFIDSLYHVILRSDLPIDNNKKIWKMKIPLETNIFAWCLRHGVILTKDNRVNITGMEVVDMFFVIKMR